MGRSGQVIVDPRPAEPWVPYGERPEPGVWQPGTCADCGTECDVDTLGRCLYCGDLWELTTRPWTGRGEPPADISGYQMVTIRG